MGPNTRKLVSAVSCLAAALVPVCALAQSQAPGPAVSGFNSKFSVEGGLYDDKDGVLFQGSVTAPLGHAYGLQVDGAAGSFDGDFLGGGGVHLFTRDPARYLLGVYASYHTWESIDISRFAGEGELYMGRITAGGLAGWEWVDVPGTKNGLSVATRDDDHHFVELDLTWYPKDDLALSMGYHYESDENLVVARLEYAPRWSGLPGSLFTTVYLGDGDHTRVTGGIRVFFGADRSKSLIRRHREDDPTSYTPVFPEIETVPPVQPPPPPEINPE